MILTLLDNYQCRPITVHLMMQTFVFTQGALCTQSEGGEVTTENRILTEGTEKTFIFFSLQM